MYFRITEIVTYKKIFGLLSNEAIKSKKVRLLN